MVRHVIYFSEYFTTNSQRLTSTEGQTVLIEFKTVEIISDVTCLWFFNDDEIKDSEKYFTKQSGVDCQLTIKDVKPSDSGVYQIRIRKLSKRTELKVQCKCYSQYQICPMDNFSYVGFCWGFIK